MGSGYQRCSRKYGIPRFPVTWKLAEGTLFSGPTLSPNLHAVQEEGGPSVSKGATGLGRSMSTRSLGLRAEVPHGVDTARSSIITMVPPTSAASAVTLFEDFEAGLNSGPQAESTPHSFQTVETSPPPAPARTKPSLKHCLYQI
jgi:hypothetical protein